MALPVTIPNAFANATASIPLSQLDTNFNTLANAVNGISDGSETLANVTATVGNITTVNATTVDTTNIEVTNIKAKDGTAAGSIADATGVVTLASSVLTTTDINGGTIDGATIGGASAAAGSFTTLNTSGAVVFNDAGADVDFRVEGDTDANLLFVDAGNDRVGIGVVPESKFHVKVATDENIRFITGGAGDTRISSLNDAASATVQLSIQANPLLFRTVGGAEAARFNSSGNLVFPNGQGIDFSASAGGGATSSILDDYEEGDWTPSFSTTGAAFSSITYTIQSARYTKIGNMVYIWGYLTVNSVSGGTGSVTISNIPFTNGGMQGGILNNWASNNWGTQMPNSGHILINDTQIYLTYFASTQTVQVPVANLISGSQFIFNGAYAAA